MLTQLLITSFLLIKVIFGQTRLAQFEIDGNLHRDSSSKMDWSDAINGIRLSTVNSSLQNWCTQTGYTSPYWKSQLFCDGFGNDENSVPTQGASLSNTSTWAPYTTGSSPGKGDITNVYVVGDSIDNLLCAAFERKGETGTVYLDIEFNQAYTSKSGCQYANTADAWRCRYNIREDGDFRTSFILKGSNQFDILIYQYVYNNTFKDYDLKSSSTGTGLLTTPSVRAAVNTQIINASSWGHVDSGGTVVTTIEADKFFESCINFTALGFAEFCFSAVTVTSKTSDASNAQMSDSSALILFEVCASPGETYAPTSAPTMPGETKAPTPPTPFPTMRPTVPPTTKAPTMDTTTTTTTSSTSTGSPTTSNPATTTTQTPTSSNTQSSSTSSTSSSSSSSTTDSGQTSTIAGEGKGSGSDSGSTGLGSLELGLIIGGSLLALTLIIIGIAYYWKKRKDDNSWYA